MMTLVKGDPFQKLQYGGVGEGVIPFPGLLHLTLDPYLIKPGNIKYHFWSLLYDSTLAYNS